MKKKYLLHDNAEIAERRVSSINECMVNPLNNMISKIKDAGVTNVSLEDVKNILINGIQAIEYLVPPIDRGVIPVQLVPMAEKERQDKITSIWNEYSIMENNLPNGMPIKSSKAISMLEMSVSGLVNINQATKEQIEEECKEYIKTPIGCELYEIQLELADRMQKFHDKLEEAMNIPGKTMSLDAKAVLFTLFPLSAFHFKRTDDDKIVVMPKIINFDPLNVED